MDIRFTWVIATICVLLSGCSLSPSRELPSDFEERAKSESFSTLVKQRFHSDENLQRYIENYWVENWRKFAGGDPVYKLQTDTNAKLAISELDNMLGIFCRVRGFEKVGSVEIPLFARRGSYGTELSGRSAQGIGCATDDRIVAAYLKDGAYNPYILRIYGDTDSLAVMSHRKSEKDTARRAKQLAKQEWRQKETSRIRTTPRLNELVYVNLATMFLDQMAGYERMDMRVAQSHAVFEGRVREVKPPMVLIENAVLDGFSRVWVPMESLEVPPRGTPYD